MRSIIAIAFSSLSLGIVAEVKAQEIPETVLTFGYHPQEGRSVWSRDYFTQDANGLYINRDNCTVWGRQIYPCE